MRTCLRSFSLTLLVLAATACGDDMASRTSVTPLEGTTPEDTGAEAAPADEAETPEATNDDAPVAPPPEMLAPSLSTYDADHPSFHYAGRIDFTDPKRPEFSAPGVYVKARFSGTAVAVLLEDEFKWGNNRSFFDVSIDGAPLPKLAPEMGVTRYLVSEELAPGEHEIVIAKRTEASIGRAAFLGLDVAGELLPAPPAPELRIEFIGDSITAGAGVEAADGSPECSAPAMPGADGGWGQPYNNANVTYAAVAARELGADYHLTAVSGIGLVRNYSFQYDARPMPEIYHLTFPEMIAGNTWDMTAWDMSRFVPNVVVVALGTNDFSPGDNPPDDPRPNMQIPAYVDAYEAFLTTLRSTYPEAEIFVLSSPMLGNGWPQPTDTFADDLRAAVTQVAERFNAAGDAKVHPYITSTVQPGLGCGTHPSVEQHRTLGLELAAELRTRLGL